MIELNYWIIPIAGLVPMIVGFIWYHPKVMGTTWMNVAGMTEEKIKGGNMPLIFGVSFIMACMLASAILQMVIHQLGFQSMLMNQPGFGEEGTEVMVFFQDAMTKYGQDFRTFKHGVLHGVLAGLFFALPILATNSLFERKGWKYILVNSGYWLITLGIMGGVICQFA
jgi:hypothetical protein